MIRSSLSAFATLAVGVLTMLSSPAQSQEIKPMRIMCVGASITMGQGVNGGYRLPLEKMLEGAGIPVQFVGRSTENSKGMTSPGHDGYPGLRIDQVADGLANVCDPIADGVRDLQPDVILILLGTNDIGQNHDIANAPQRMEEMIGRMRAVDPKVTVYVSALPPFLKNDDAMRSYNAGLYAMVQKHAAAGETIRYVDNYQGMSAVADIQPDRTHPTLSGYLKIARNFFGALAPGAGQTGFDVTYEGATQFIGSSCFGYKITVKTAATVTDLGIYSGGKPLDQTRAVGVFDSDGKVLVRTDITTTVQPSGLFVYQKLEKPLTLKAGNSYFFISNSVGLGSLIGSAAIVDPLFYDNPRFYFDHNVAVKLPGATGTTFQFPGTALFDQNGGLGYFGPNFRLEAQQFTPHFGGGFKSER